MRSVEQTVRKQEINIYNEGQSLPFEIVVGLSIALLSAIIIAVFKKR